MAHVTLMGRFAAGACGLWLAGMGLSCSSNEPSDGGGPGACTFDQQTACEVDLSSAALSPPADIPLCIRELEPDHPGMGLYAVCLVDPEGRVYLTILGGTSEVASAGWSHSSYGGGLFPSNLSSADEARCQQAFDIQFADAQDDAGVCPGLFTN